MELLDCINALLAARQMPQLDISLHQPDDVRRQLDALVRHTLDDMERSARAEERLNLALLGSRQAIWDTDVETGQVYLSEHWEALLGRPARATTHPLAHLLDLIHPDDRQGAAQAMLALVKSPGDEPLLHEHRVRHASGRWIWISSYGKVTQRAPDGFVVRMTGINSDISHRKAIESELAHQLAMAEAIIEAMPMPLAISSTNRSELRTNLAWQARRGVADGADADSCLDSGVSDLLAAAGSLAAADHRVRVSGRPLRLRKRIWDHSGDNIELQFDKTPVLDDQGSVSAVVTVTSDLTQMVATERAAEAGIRTKADFLTVVSHELRTPLTAIQGALDLLAGSSGQQPPEQARALTVLAQTAAERLGRLIDDLVDAEKIESGRLRLQARVMDISTLVKRAVELNEIYARQRGVRLVVDVPESAVAVLADEGRLQQVFANLISNAAKHSRSGESVHVSMRLAATGRAVRIAVTDSGPGVAPELRGRLFEKFTQPDHDTLLRGQEGLGLGLAISRALVEQHGGRVGYKDAPGGGALFWFELPLHEITRAALA